MTSLSPETLIRREGLPRKHLSSPWNSGTSAVTTLTLIGSPAELAAGTFDGQISLWALEGRRLATVTAGGTAITVLGAAGALLASGDFGGEVSIWRRGAGDVLEPVWRTRAHAGSVRALEFVGDVLVTAAHEGTVKLWRAGTGELIAEIRPDSAPLAAMRVDLQRRRVYCAGASGTVYAIDIDGPGPARAIAHLDEPISTIALVTDRPGLLIGTTGHRLVRIDIDGNLLGRSAERAPSWPTGMLIDEQRGIAVVTAADLTARVWDLRDLSPRGFLPGEGASMGAVALQADGTLYRGDDRGGIRRLTLETDETAADGHEGSIWSVAIDPEGRWVLTSGSDNSARVWDTATGEEVHRLRGHHGWVNTVAFSGDGRSALSGSSDGTIRIWRTGSWEHVGTLRGHAGWVNGAALSADGRTALSGSSDGTVRIWNVATGENISTLTGHTGWVNAVAYASEAGIALSASADCTVRVWDLRSLSELAVLSGHEQGVTSVHVSADGRRGLSAGYDGAVNCWDLAGGMTRTCAFDDHEERIWVVSSGRSGRIAVTAGGDATLRLWDIERQQPLARYTLDAPVTACAMQEAPDRTRLVAYGQRDGRFGLIRFSAV